MYNGRPTLDPIQNLEQIWIRRDSATNKLKFSFRRKLITCDDKDFPITVNLCNSLLLPYFATFSVLLQEDTLRVLYAYSDTVPSGAKIFTKHQMEHRGSRSLILFNYELKDPVVKDKSVKTLDYLADKFPVSSPAPMWTMLLRITVSCCI